MMEPRSLEFIASACSAQLRSGSGDVRVVGISTDSRRVEPGELFVALKGERFDGHDFIHEVAAKAAAVVAEQSRTPSSLGKCALLVVDDTRKALGRLAGEYRKDFGPRMVAVSGSNGKTTTKEIIAAVLNQRLSTLASQASFNNEIGVPLTLLQLDRSHGAAVLEAGTNHPGELAPLIRMIGPEYGVITSIGREHLEFFGDLEGVAREEGWLAELLPAGGKLLLDGDSPWSARLRERTRASVTLAGWDQQNAWRVSSVRQDRQGIAFRVVAPRNDFSGEYRLGLLGRHQAVNALFAIAIAADLGLTRSEVEHGLAECKPSKMRLQLWEANGVRVLDDAYNANADSMAAALLTLRELPCKGRRVAVLGDMAELGAQSEQAHEEIGRRAAETGVGQLFAVGKMAPVTARGARQAGLNRVMEFSEVDTAAVAVKSFLKEGDLVLLKASRAARLERIAELLRAAEGNRKTACCII
jgi:UDP-N-acetylmuramoyl-tripeptide--D-alanyl-D-alanine ligase